MLRTDGTLQNSGEVYNANGTLENSGGVPAGVFEYDVKRN